MNDPASRLPAHPSLEQLRKQAKDLLRDFRDGDAVGVTRFAATIPRFASATGLDAQLADAQFIVAREYGFENWAALAAEVEQLTGGARPAKREPIRPIQLAASRMVDLSGGRQAPADAAWEMFSAAREGDLTVVRSLAAHYPGLERFEYNYTPPIHFAVREGHDAVVRFLVERGADLAYKTYPFGDSLLTMAEDREHHDVSETLRGFLSRKYALADGVGTILDAAKVGDLARVQSELARNAALASGADDLGQTPLHRAAEHGHLRVVEALLAAGANPNAVRGDGYKPLHVALMNSWRAGVTREQAGVIADRLIAAGADYTIYIAALRGDKRFVRDALARDPSLANFEDTCHFRPISAAAQRGDLEMVKLLIDHGADPNLPEEGAPAGQALWHAVYNHRPEIVVALVEAGASPNAMVESSGTPMMHARNDEETFELLAVHGGDTMADDEDVLSRALGEDDFAEVERILRRRPDLVHNEQMFWHEGLLCGPAAKPNRAMVELLLRYGARVPTVTKWGRFYYFKHTEMVEFLLQKGANPNHMNWHRTTILHHLGSDGDLVKAKLLVDHGADINAIDEEYRSTPLGMAARWGQRGMVEFFLQRGAEPTAAGAAWATPVAWARKKGHRDIESMLQSATTNSEQGQ